MVSTYYYDGWTKIICSPTKSKNSRKENHPCHCKHDSKKRTCHCDDSLPNNKVFKDMIGKEVLLVLSSHQLNILGETFRPIFTGTVEKVTEGYITLSPVIIKIPTAPYYKFPTPLNFPIEHITYFMPFDSKTPIPIS